jgi:hypothetical protein
MKRSRVLREKSSASRIEMMETKGEQSGHNTDDDLDLNSSLLRSSQKVWKKTSILTRFHTDIQSSIWSWLSMDSMFYLWCVSQHSRCMVTKHFTRSHTLVVPNIQNDVIGVNNKLVEGIVMLMSIPKQLRTIRMGKDILEDHSHELCSNIILAIIELVNMNQKTLQIINLIGGYYEFYYSDKIMSSATQCPKLTSFKFDRIASTNDHVRSLMVMSKQCKLLNKFEFSFDPLVNYDTPPEDLLLTGTENARDCLDL